MRAQLHGLIALLIDDINNDPHDNSNPLVAKATSSIRALPSTTFICPPPPASTRFPTNFLVPIPPSSSSSSSCASHDYSPDGDLNFKLKDLDMFVNNMLPPSSSLDEILGASLLCWDIMQNSRDSDLISQCERFVWMLTFKYGEKCAFTSTKQHDYAIVVPDDETLFDRPPLFAVSSSTSAVVVATTTTTTTMENHNDDAMINEVSALQVWDDALELELSQCAYKEIERLTSSLVELKNIATELAFRTSEMGENISYTESKVEDITAKTRQGAYELAKSAKTRTKGWGLKGSGAGAVGGSLLSLGFGPVGLVAGMSLGGIVGYKSGESLSRRQNAKYDQLIKTLNNRI